MSSDLSIAALQEAVSVATSQGALADAINARLGTTLKQGHIWSWLRKGRTPEDYCPAIEAATGVPCERLRSDRQWTRDSDGVPTGYHVPIAAKPDLLDHPPQDLNGPELSPGAVHQQDEAA